MVPGGGKTAGDKTAGGEPSGGEPSGGKKRAAFQALRDRILNGAGRTSREQRARAFGNAGLPGPLGGLVGHVAASPVRVSDADFAAARAAGFTGDELFELVICAAVGQSARQYDAGLAALAEAEEDG